LVEPTERDGTPIAEARDSGAPGPRAGVVLGPGELRPIELTTEVLTSIEGIRALKPDYERLCQVTGNALPFALQDWHLTWCAHFLNRYPRVREQPLFCALRNRMGECVAIVPLILARRRIGPLEFVTADMIGADPGLSEIRTSLIEPGYERLTVRAVHASLARIPHWDWIHWRGICGALTEAIALETTPHWYHISEDYVLDMPSSWQEFRADLKRNIRESLRHCYNSLRREGHAFEFSVARECAEVRQALDRFLVLHAMRARMTWGAKHPDRFAERSSQEFLYDVCNRLAARNAVRVFELRIAAESVASRIAFVVGDSLYLYYSGFNPAWARYSVMTTTVAEALKYAIANDIRTVNLSLTGEQSKLRWGPRRVEYHSALVHREVLSSRIACRVATSRAGRPVRLLTALLWGRRGWH
jgi:CelD/BcsL family acetyltransferase involved in cellulose biosynthesis